MNEVDDLRKENAALEAEVERLKAHTWEQERAAVVAWLRRLPTWPFRSPLYYATCIERGEHWSTEGREE
jgi:hypothetical protein